MMSIINSALILELLMTSGLGASGSLAAPCAQAFALSSKTNMQEAIPKRDAGESKGRNG